MIVAEYFGFVVGIDTHAKTHTLAIIETASGTEIANETFPATSTGDNRALSWILRRLTHLLSRFYSPWKERDHTGRNSGTSLRRRLSSHRSARP